MLAGDSISFGYGPRVKTLLEGVFEVANLPENGKTSENLRVHINEWMIKPRFQVIHLNCGLHDLAIERNNNSHRVSLERYRENVEEIIRRLKNETSAILIWATTTPVIDEWHRIRKGFDRFESDVRLYNEATLKVMAGLNVPVNDLHAAIMEAGREKCIRLDGVHMNTIGYDLLAKAVADILLNLKNTVE
ncbi:MAG: SGNH/GDSL hydrolase family protein [Candidatus Bathyarchaeota archaeon]|nr:SGNH/GDSL hydrolase family protein [Candidatus Bathyarchaeota archaeon]